MQKLKIKRKTSRERQIVTYKGVPIRLSTDFSKETLQARRDWQEVFKVMKNKDQLKGIYSASQTGKAKGVHHQQAIII